MSNLNYKPNSHRSKETAKKEERKKLDKVVSGKVIKKKNTMRKIADVIVAEDKESVKNYVLLDVLVPAVKKAITDIIVNGLDMVLYGGSGEAKKSTRASRVSYWSGTNTSREDRFRDNRTRSGYSYDDVVLETRAEAKDVLDRLDEALETYGTVSVADLYDLVGERCEHTDNKYGWTNIRNAEIINERDGYRIKMPRALPLD